MRERRIPSLSSLFSLVVLFAVALLPARAMAAPEAHILRIDPRAGIAGGAPILTTVIEVVQMNRLSDVLRPCATVSGFDATIDCWSNELDKPNALWSRFPFPESNAHFFVKVAGEDQLTKFVSKQDWGAASKDPSVGTAWLLALDASSGMGARYGEARAVALQFIETMQPNDIMDLMIFGDQQVNHDSKWKTFAQRNDLVAVLNAQPGVLPSKGNDRPLFNLVKTMTQDAFGDLGSSTGPANVPLHQAMVFLSNGAGRGDPASASPSAEVFAQYLNKGRFPDDNTSLPKTPLPVISIWFPNKSSLANDAYRNNDAQFMQSLANPGIGGYFNVIRSGGVEKGKNIINLVRARFNAMYVVKWRLSCLNPSVEQTFNLIFENTKPLIAPDGTFKDVPIGVDPTLWPLDVDVEKTKAEANANPLYPGGKFTVFGEFCWSGDKTRAESYFIPAGTKPSAQTNSRDPELAKRAMQELIRQNMRGGSIESGDAFVTFTVPDDEKVLEGAGENTVARLLVYDNKAKRASAVDEKTVLTLKAQKKPFNLLLILGIAGGVVVILLLLVVLLRGGGNRGGGGGKRGRTPPPAPIVAGGGYGAPGGGGGGGGYGGGGYNPQGGGVPPGGYGGPPQGGGGGGGGGGGYRADAPASPYGAAPASPYLAAPPGAATPAVAPLLAQPAQPPAQAAAQAAAYRAPSPSGVAQVACPSCGMTTMVTPGLPSMCFSCGQPIGADAAKGGGGASAPFFPLDWSHSVAPSTAAQPVRV